MALPFRYSFRNLWVRRTTTFATIVGIGLVVFVLAATLMLAAGVKRTMTSAGRADRAIVMQGDAYSEGDSRMRQSVLGIVGAAPGVRRDAAGEPLVVGETIVHVYLSAADDPSSIDSVQIRGISAKAFLVRDEVRLVEGRLPKPGTDEAIVGKRLFGRYQGLRLGDGFELQKKRRVTIVGAFAADGAAYESEVWADLDAVRSSFGFQGYLSSITARLESPQSFEGFAGTLRADKRQGLSVERERAYYEKVSEGLSHLITGLGSVVALIFSLGALLGAAITMYGAVSQRTREIGVLKALGFARTEVMLVILLESTLLAAAGGALGIGVALLTPLFDFSAMNYATGQQLVFRFVPELGVLGRALASGTLVGVLGGLFPALRAASVNPTELF
ncbi:MAG TPA: FtsX-like permease family protein [Polyangiaceae bacterium]|nr:FtsX-like permease family protein [Polyangiaceae bacterium]